MATTFRPPRRIDIARDMDVPTPVKRVVQAATTPVIVRAPVRNPVRPAVVVRKPPLGPQMGPTPPRDGTGKVRRDKVVGSSLGSVSNSMAPHESLLHPTDMALFKKKGKRP